MLTPTDPNPRVEPSAAEVLQLNPHKRNAPSWLQWVKENQRGRGESLDHRAHTQNAPLKLELERVQLDSGKLSIGDIMLEQLNKITLPIQTLLCSFGSSKYVEKPCIWTAAENNATIFTYPTTFYQLSLKKKKSNLKSRHLNISPKIGLTCFFQAGQWNL